jgi:hypothetical protein
LRFWYKSSNTDTWGAVSLCRYWRPFGFCSQTPTSRTCSVTYCYTSKAAGASALNIIVCTAILPALIIVVLVERRPKWLF